MWNFKKPLILFILILIVLLGGYLRLVNLEDNPNGLYVDEASTGYNAWSILLTEKDEYGKDYPYMFRFLGSYTPPVYTYLTSLNIKLFGLSISSIRLLSALSGIAMIIVVFLLVKSLKLTNNFLVVILAASLFAISPWSIFYSRIGYEIHLAFLFYSLGVLFLWLSLKSKWYFVLGAIFLALSSNTYHAERLLAPSTLILFIALFRKDILKKKYVNILGSSLIVYVLILIPQILIFNTLANTSRGLGLLYDLPLLSFIREFLSQYLAYFSPRNLFFQPDSDLQRSLPELSVFYPWMVIPYFIGIITLIKRIREKNYKFLALLLFIAPIPAALTSDPFSTQRALPLLLPILIIVSLGIDQILGLRFKKISILVMFTLTLFSLLYLYRSYAVLLSNERAKVWGYGFNQLAEEIKKRPEEKFIIDSSRIKPAYIELAFFLKIHPSVMQQAVDQNIKNNYYNDTVWKGHYILDNFETRSINFNEDSYKQQILVGDSLAISEGQVKEHFSTPVFVIESPSKEIIFQGFKTNPDLKCQQSKDKLKCYDLN